MTRGTFVIRNGELVEKGGPKDVRPAVTRSGLPCPMIISDHMDAVEHPADGQFYASKSKFRQVTRANGMIEVGNDPARFRRPTRPNRDKGIEQAIDKAIARAS